MSVRFKLVQMFENSVSSRFATVCQKKSTRRGPPAKRDPKTTSAWPSRMGWSRRGYSAGSYSRSASWTRAISPVTCSTARRTAAPLPWLCSWKRTEEHTSELQSRLHLVCRLLLEKKKNIKSECHIEKDETQRNNGLIIYRGV